MEQLKLPPTVCSGTLTDIRIEDLMRYYFFGDIHGNEYALERCLNHLKELRADGVYCLGDIVGWLPFGDRTLKRIKSLNIPTVAGNHDLLVAGLFTDHSNQLDRMQASAYNAGLLSTIPGASDYLLGLPLLIEEERFALTHHSPFHLPRQRRAINIESFNYLDKAAIVESLESWRNYPKRIILSGHDHIPAVYELPDADHLPRFEDVIIHQSQKIGPLIVRLKPHSRYWIKAGSVGGPYRDGIAVCNSALLDTDEATITLFRLPYPLQRLHQELDNHRFCKNLPTLKRYIELLRDNLNGSKEGK